MALVPEGLPLALAAGLTAVAKRLCDKHAVMLKQLATVDTLGSMSLLASDKTGTLTQNRMTVVSVVLGEGAENSPASAVPSLIATASVAPISRLVRGAMLCNDATYAPFSLDALSSYPPRIVGGNSTDKALLSWALTLGGASERHAWFPLLSVPFSSVMKEVCNAFFCCVSTSI